MDQQQWNAWCRNIAERIAKIEKSLASYHKMQKRMLYVILLGFVAVLGNGILLFYK